MMQIPSNNLFKSDAEILGADSRRRILERWLSAAWAHSAELVGMGLFASIISLVFTPFMFGTSNNIFHIPYVLNFAARPEFANDQFYQTLKYFTSVVWPVMRLLATETNVYWLFFAAQVISRASAFVALAFMLVALGVRSRGVILLGLVIAAVSPWLRGASLVGQHGLFINFFNHSEFTWPFIIAALLCTLRRRYIWAAVLAAVTVSINAFVGFWLLLMMAACVLCCKPRPTIAACAKATLLLVMLTLPIALWIKSALAAPGSGADVSFTEYVRLYYPYHFLIEAAQGARIKNLLFVLIAGIVASRWIANGHFWRVAVATAAAIFLVGTFLPYLFDIRMIFNLHLLRVDGVFQLLCIVMVIGASLIKLSQANGARGTLV
ncbi:MAG: hypothetical protein JWP38_1331, partial [Herbaspirillum sp.]|nr:hypothetical protein [Herbaspirillum sp.]